MQLVNEWASQYQEELLTEWGLARRGQPLNPVPPLTQKVRTLPLVPDVLRIDDADPLEDHVLRLASSTGETRSVGVRPLIEDVGGPVSAPLLDPSYFARVSVDPTCGTVVWPNGADLAPTALYALAEELSIAE